MKVTDEDGFLSCSMMIKAKNIIMKERALGDDMKRLRSEDDEKHKETRNGFKQGRLDSLSGWLGQEPWRCERHYAEAGTTVATHRRKCCW